MHRLEHGRLGLVGTVRPGDGAMLATGVLPLRFGLEPGDPRPRIVADHADGIQRWVI